MLADEHHLFREVVGRALGRDRELAVVGEAGNGAEALRLIEALEPDLALVDLRMPDLDGAEICARLSSRLPPLSTQVVIISGFLDPGCVARAVAAGAAGYIGKDASRETIRRTLRRVGSTGAAKKVRPADQLEQRRRRTLRGPNPTAA